LGGHRVVEALMRLGVERSLPKTIRAGNQWAYLNKEYNRYQPLGALGNLILKESLCRRC